MPDPVAVTAADIARLAGVTRGTVSNWRRRHADFPAPVGGTDASPAFDRTQVERWLSDRDALPEASPDDLLWRAVTAAAADKPLEEVLAQTAGLLTELAEGPLPHSSPTAAGFAEIRRILATELAGRNPAETLDALLNRYADSAGVAMTPQPVADLMAELADARGKDVFDPAAGTGELLEASLTWGPPGGSAGYGQELDPGLAQLADARVWLVAEADGFGNGESGVEPGDSLRHDAFPDLRVHSVLCHPPFGTRDWGLDELADDPRWTYGVPPRSEPELAWVQHALAHLEAGGRAALLMPPAAAARPSGRRIRAELLRRGALQAVISLPAGAVQPRHVPVHLWVLRNPGRERTPDPRVLFADQQRHRGGDGAGPGFDELIREAWYAFESGAEPGAGEPGRWQVVRAIDLLDESVDLTPARHVGALDAAQSPALAMHDTQALAGTLRARLRTIEESLSVVSAVRDGGSAPPWRSVPVADLARQGALGLYRWPGRAKAESEGAEISVRPGDVLVPAAATAPITAEVVDDVNKVPDKGQFHVIRPDPALLAPWYLAGFLTAPASVQQASYGTSAIRRIDARRLTVPLLPLEHQRRYGEIFKRLHDLSAAIADAGDIAKDLTAHLTLTLAEGKLQPAQEIPTESS